MPLYEYQCESCQASFEKLVADVAARDRAACPKCGSKKTRRAFSAFAVGQSGGGGDDVNPCANCDGESCPMED
jgi:putative FmdB family regulatory protein